MAHSPTELSRQLRTGTSEDLQRRRWIVGLSLLGVAAGQVVTLFQTGIIKRLPDPPMDVFDSTKVDASEYAYKRGNMPDAPAMIGTYALTSALASMGGENRATEQPWIPIAMTAKIAGDIATNAVLLKEEWQGNEKLCFYCQTATVVSLVSLALALPETLRAVDRLRNKA